MATVTPIKPKANFRSKRERKAARKTLWKKGVNIAADRALKKEAKREFAKKMRIVKIRRMRVAAELDALAEQLRWMVGDLDRAVYRCPGINEATVDAAVEMVRYARQSVHDVTAAAERFAARPIYEIVVFGSRSKGGRAA